MSAVVLRGDAAHLPLPDGSVDLIVTSPPYFALREYRDAGKPLTGQIGSEGTPQEYLAALWDCTREWIRVLKPKGSVFVNLGDKYSNYFGSNWGHGRDFSGERGESRVPVALPVSAPSVYGIPAKSLMGLPWRYALGCIDHLGLILRQDCIDDEDGGAYVWAKRNGLPESVTDRCRRAHEYVFHFTKQPRYFSAVDEIREPHADVSVARSRRAYNAGDLFSVGTPNTLDPAQFVNPLGKLPGSVWEIPTAPLVVPDHVAHARCCGGRKRPGCTDGLDHFAAFPPALPARIILGWSPSGICTACGEGRRPVVNKVMTSSQRAAQPRSALTRYTALGRERDGMDVIPRSFDATITGYACACPDATAPTRPAVVVDPFGGTGTTSLVADVLGRTGITVDRSADYCRLARWRTRDPGERARALGVPKPPPVPEGQASLFDLEAS